jgi:hypothetical protein
MVSGMTLIGKEIGELLVDNGLLTPEDLGVVEQEKLKTGESISKILARLGFASENQLKDTLELNYGVTFVSLAKLNPDLDLVKRVPEDVIRQLQVVPISLTSSRLTLAMVNPDDSNALNEIRNYIQSDSVKSLVCIHDDFDTCVDHIFGAKAQLSRSTNGNDSTALFEPDLSFIDDTAPLSVRASGINTGENALIDSARTIDALSVDSLDQADEVETAVSDRPPPDLGELLLSKRIIDDDQLYDALKIGLKTRQSLAEVLISMELVTEEDLQFLLAEYFGSPLVESFEAEEPALESEIEEQYADPVLKVDVPLVDDVDGLVLDDLPESLEDVVSDEQLRISDEVIAEEELEFSDEMLSPEQLELLNRVMSQGEPAIAMEVTLEEQPEIIEEAVLPEDLSSLPAELLADEEAEILEHAVAEEEPKILAELVAEEETEILEQVLVEDEPEILNELIPDEEPQLVNELVAEEEPAVPDELVAEEEPAVLDEIVVEEEPAVPEEVVVEEEPAVPEEVVVEEEPAVPDQIVFEGSERESENLEKLDGLKELEHNDIAGKIEADLVPNAVAEDKRDLSVLEAITPPAKEETVALVEPQPVPKTVPEVKVQQVIIEAPQVTAALSSEKSKQIAAARGSDSESGDFKIVEEDKAKPAQICPPAQIAASSPRLVKAETGQFDINKSLQPGKASNGSKADIATVTDPDELEDDIDFLDLVKQAQYASISLLANHVTSTAIEQKCSDILVQGISDNVVVQYLKKGRVVSESRLVKQILPDLVACYKEMAGLDKTLTNKPQDRKVKLNVRETDIELRVTTVPEDDGEIVAISIKYL